ncbi:Lysosomal Pro-X carboxypeptidase [Eumeta japonica]|uniref:Lysosomal Pro-X carboxypeptidase n=1 Tax=Eumeta variegata TaxID=151549 RepID=A0A4C1TG27_EUMVA|nr:Lysosomal Pro-X carboxypeptidase [Eumeta japonica]
MVMPMCSDGINDMFEHNPWNYTTFAQNCKKKYGVIPKPEAARIKYGGDNLRAASNIVFSNGLLDPWTGGGILSNINDDVKAIIIKKSAHHLDLMASNPNDPRSVVVARTSTKNNIRNWITNFAQPMGAFISKQAADRPTSAYRRQPTPVFSGFSADRDK